MPSWLIDTFGGGVSDHENKGQRGAFKTGSALDIRKLVDSLSCQQALLDITPAGWNALCTAHVVASDGNSYFFLNNGKIFKMTSGGVFSLVHTDTSESGNITGAEEWYDNAGWTYLVWATPTRLNIKKIIGPSYSNTEPWADVNTASTGTWPKTNLTSAIHTMKQVNGTLQICNGNVMAMVGYDLSYTNLSLQLIPGHIARTVIERGLDAIIGAARLDAQDKSMLFSWDQIALNYNAKKLIPVKTLNALIDTDKPLAQVGDNGAIYYADFLNVLPITYFTGGGKVNPGGVENDQGLALFGVFGNGAGNTGIWSFGKKRNNDLYALNLEYPFTCSEIGTVKKMSTDLFVTYNNSGTFGIKKVDLTAKATATYGGLDLEVPAKYIKGDQELPTFTEIKIITAPLPASTSVQVKRKINKTGSFNSAELEGGGTAFNTATGTEALFKVGDMGRIIEPQVILTPSGNNSPEVYSIEVFFELPEK